MLEREDGFINATSPLETSSGLVVFNACDYPDFSLPL